MLRGMRRAARIARALGVGLGDGIATAMAVSVLGALLLVLTGRIEGDVSASIEALGWAAGAGAIVGIGLGPAMVLWRGLAPGFGRADMSRRAIGAGLALPWLQAGVALAAADWAREHELLRPVLTVTGAAAVAAGLAWRGATRDARRGWIRALARFGPAAAPVLIWVALPDHVRAHVGVDWACALAAAAPYAPAGNPRARTSVLVTVTGAAAIAWLALRFGARPGLRAAVEREHGLVQRVVAYAAGSFDFDGDGASAWFGGGDCAPWDARAAPGRAEIAANGIDDNCVAGDLADDAAPTLPAGRAPPPPVPLRNVVVISVDALRPDHMSTYGYARPTTPMIDELLAGAYVFERAYAEAASTRDTLPSLLSGRSRFELWWYRHRNATLDPRERLLPHQLVDLGYETIGVLPFVAINMMGTARLGFSRLEIYDDKKPRSAAEVTSRTLAAIDETQGPFFAFVHYYEPHEPYVRHRRVAEVSDEPYDQEIAAVDREIGRLWQQLRASGRLRDTLVVLTSDHGEAFSEHGHRFHNAGAYEEDLRVPLLVVVPGQTGHRIAAPVSNTAIAATVLQLLQIDPPAPAPTVGSLWPLMSDDTAPVDPVFAVARPDLDHERFAFIDGHLKVIFDRTFSSLEVYDLRSDPGETTNLLALQPAVADALIDRAASRFDATVGAAQSRRRRAMIADGLPPGATAIDVSAATGVDVEGFAAWSVDPEDSVGTIATRVMVRTYLRRTEAAAGRFEYEVTIEREGAVQLRADGPPWRGHYDASAWAEGDLVEDTRVFKVYPRDRDAHVVVRIGGATTDLGTVGALAVAPDG
jgi:arylsulfatase A-like enzyme